MGLKELICKRKDILFAEIGALIHDLGKLSKEFVSQKSLDNLLNVEKDKHAQWIFEWHSNLGTLLNNFRICIEEIPVLTKKGKKLISIKKSLKELIESHHNNKKIIQKKFEIKNMANQDYANKYLTTVLSKSADGIDSGIDKMVIEKCEYIKQITNYTYIATAFGYEKRKINLDKLKLIHNQFTNKLYQILTLLQSDISISNWFEKRDELFRETKKAFLNALGETRRPANDVTLWDHSFSVASLYKAALAEVVITKKCKDPKDIKWKLLSIRFDGDKFYYTVPKIADVLGRKNLVGKILDNIKNLLEVVIPIGNEIYRDENGSVFLVPMNAKDENWEVFEINDDVWKEIKDVEFKNVALNFKGEWENKKLEEMTNKPNNLKELIKNISSFMSEGIFFPEIYLSEPSRGALNLGKEISKKTKHKFDIEKLKQKWIGKENGYEKCTACGLKPVPLSYEEKKELDEKIKKEGWEHLTEEEKNQYKAYERKICLDCLKLAQNRVEEWYRNTTWNKETPEKPSFDTSIWLDEIADENNRIALVYLSFDLEKWLNGEMLNTFLSKPIEILKESGLVFNDYESIVSHIKGNFDKKYENFWKVFDPYSKDKIAEKIFEEIVESRDENWKENYKTGNTPIDENDIEAKAKILLLHLTRKHPSFARLRRIWETTRNFGIDVFEKVKSKLKSRERVIINFDFNDSLQITHTYWFKHKNKRSFELVVIENKNKAAIISNCKDIEIPKSKRLDLYNENFKTYITTLTNVTVQKKEKYYPLIPYQFEPSKTLFFMPLKDVWEVMQLIKKEYEIQFNKVQNRLPINIGFVAFHKRTPMYAVLDAAKRMYSKKKENPEKFKVCSIYEMDAQKNCRLYEGKIGNRVKEIRLENGYEYHFSYSTGDPDPEKEDLFHPYFIVENNNGWKTYVEGNWKTIRHVKYLEKEDEISFYPSYFDFLWLDTNTRRLDVGEERIHWLFKEFSPKPYNLKDIESFERLRILLLEKLKLTTSQLLNIYGLLISKLEEWHLPNKKLPIDDEVFKGVVKNAILSIPLRLKIDNSTERGKITKDDFEFLKTTILNGMFFDFIDMWHTILKRKFREDE